MPDVFFFDDFAFFGDFFVAFLGDFLVMFLLRSSNRAAAFNRVDIPSEVGPSSSDDDDAVLQQLLASVLSSDKINLAFFTLERCRLRCFLFCNGSAR